MTTHWKVVVIGSKQVTGSDMEKDPRQVKARKDKFVKKQSTKIWLEKPDEVNPYISVQNRCYGYDLMDLFEKRSYIEILFLIFRGELPSTNQAQLLESLMKILINPGPRHPATRSAMLTGIGKTNPAHILPISLGILSGSHLGSEEVAKSIRFLRKHRRTDPEETAMSLATERRETDGDAHPAPGFGSRFGSIDPMAEQFAQKLCRLPEAGKALRWGQDFSTALNNYNMGWLTTGVAAAALTDLGFSQHEGAGFFQIISAPGLLAHGLEFINKPFTAMPFPTDEDYIIEE